jgi:hypothetical protein
MAIKRDTLTNLKLNVGNERLYLDVDEMLGNVEIFTRDKEGRDIIELNLPKFEFFKMMLDTVCNTVEDVDDNLGVVSLNKLPVSSKLAINTLIKYKIIKKL